METRVEIPLRGASVGDDGSSDLGLAYSAPKGLH